MSVTLVLDTNILRQEGMSSRNMQVLSRLTNSGEVNLFLPNIVCREFVSQKTLDVQDQANKCLAALGEIGRQVGAKSEIQGDVANFKEKLGVLANCVAAEIERDFKQWMAASKANVIEFNAADMAIVLDDYFAGSGAFRRPKHRDDIPDAIVGVTMRRLLEERDRVHVAIKDGAFKKHLQSEEKYKIVDGLSEFFELEEIKQLLLKLDSKEKNAAAFKSLVGGVDFQLNLTKYFRGAHDLLEYVYVDQESIGGIENLGIDVWGVSINYAQASEIADIKYFDVKYIDQGHLSIALMIKTVARVDYAAFYYEYNNLPPDRDVDQWSMDGDGACDLRESRNVALIGYVELLFDKEWDPNVLAIHSQYLSAKDSQIQIELDIQEATIL